MKVEEGYKELTSYTRYSEYEDANIHEIGKDRSVPEVTCETMRGDTNSQYITFQMPRYYDGVDLTTKQIMVRWFNDDNVAVGGSYADICDARYNEEFIRFAWLLDYAVTEHPGPVVFTFQTIGANETQNSYVWKTKQGKLTVTDNLDNGAGGDKPTEDWFTKLMARIDEMYRAAQTAEEAAASANGSKEACDTATTKANKAAGDAAGAAGAAGTAAQEAQKATTNANTATGKAIAAADEARKAAEAVFTDKNFLLKRNKDKSLTLVFNEEPATQTI